MHPISHIRNTHTTHADRRRHLRRLQEEDEQSVAVADPAILRHIRALGLGRKQTGKDAKQYRQGVMDGGGGGGSNTSTIGAAGFATYMAASGGGAAEGWPAFKHMLPEVAFAGE